MVIFMRLKIENEPELGDVRIIEKFLLIPRSLPDRKGEIYFRFFEKAKVRQVYKKHKRFDYFFGPIVYKSWFDIMWED